MSLLYQLMAKLAQKVYVNITAILTSLRYKYVDKTIIFWVCGRSGLWQPVLL